VDLVGELPAPNESFETATKAMPARVEVRLRTGEVHSAERSIPVGAIGPDTRANHPDLVRAKFLAVGGPEETADIAANLPAASAAQVREMLSLALR
jgi:hypothetical protein